MTDSPGPNPEQRLPAPRPESAPVPVERVAAPVTVHREGLTPERAAKIVSQSASARWVAFLAVTVVAIFVAAYYFYETGVPGVDNSSRLGKEVVAQQVTDVTSGYRLFQANCARCHGAQGEGGIGPQLNDQQKLLTHLTPKYITTVLTDGGRYVCGDANSLMPAWLEPNGPLNYRDVEEIVAFIRATTDTAFQGIDPATGTTTTLHGWRDANYKPAPGATPFPNCWKDAFNTPSSAPSAAPSGSAAPGGSPAPSGGATVVLTITAQGVAFDKKDLEVPANTPFKITFINNDAGIPHNVAIHKDSPTGAEIFKGEIFPGVATKTYDVPALPAGTYGFLCTVHPTMTGTLIAK